MPSQPNNDPRELGIPAHLREKYRVAERNHAASLDALRAALCGYADGLRALGMSRDRMLAVVHEVMAELHRGQVPPARTTGEHTIMVDEMLVWCEDHRARRP